MTRIIVVLALIGLMAWVRAEDARKVVPVQFRLAEEKPGEGLTEMVVPGTDRKVYLHEQVELANADVATAVVRRRRGEVEIQVTFNEAGKEKLAKVTTAHVGKCLAIVVDGKLRSAPVIREAITGGQAMITGQFTLEEAQQLAAGILGK